MIRSYKALPPVPISGPSHVAFSEKRDTVDQRNNRTIPIQYLPATPNAQDAPPSSPVLGGDDGTPDDKMATFLFLAGPPASGRLWADAIRRVRHQGHEAEAVELFDGPPSEEETWSSRIDATIAGLTGPVVLVAHGTAVPVARHLSIRTNLAGLVLSNGPLDSLPVPYRIAVSMARAPGPLGHALLRPRIHLAMLASSIGLRRTVVNPYVWDHDTVVTVCGPLFADRDTRGRVRRFLAALPETIRLAPRPAVPTLLVWGDTDPLFSWAKADLFACDHKNISAVPIDGGHHFHPLERPWEIADKAVTWLESLPTTT
jgi:pimeloyl-ACP methyl ester carboxylesterase